MFVSHSPRQHCVQTPEFILAHRLNRELEDHMEQFTEFDTKVYCVPMADGSFNVGWGRFTNGVGTAQCVRPGGVLGNWH